MHQPSTDRGGDSSFAREPWNLGRTFISAAAPKAASAYGNGTVRHDQPAMIIAQGTGNGRGGTELYGGAYPYRVEPTYWLARHESSEPWVPLDLAQVARVKRVRLLKTSNGGLSDQATIVPRVGLLDDGGEVVASRTDHFGKPFRGPVTDPPVPYSEAYRFWYEPGTPVLFGEGAKEVTFDATPLARSVRITILRSWGFGGGLNAVRVFGG